MRARLHFAMSRALTCAGGRYMGRIQGMRLWPSARSRSPISPPPGRARPYASVSCETLAARGVQEAILVSQDTPAYGRDPPGGGDIGDLLLALRPTRLPPVRPLYPHPPPANHPL